MCVGCLLGVCGVCVGACVLGRVGVCVGCLGERKYLGKSVHLSKYSSLSNNRDQTHKIHRQNVH